MPKSFYFSPVEKLFRHAKSCIHISLKWRNEMNKEITLASPYFSVRLKSSNAIVLGFLMKNEIWE